MEAWRLLRTWNREPGFHMALDEAQLLVPADRPTLRFYTWRPAALSLGYFQRVAEVPEVERAEAVVRRLTGGGAIHHAEELTFSIGAPLSHPLYQGGVRASYRRVHAAIAAALAAFGVSAALRGDRPLSSDAPASGMCFRRSTTLDLSWEGAKGVGSAQRRTRGRVLHHGSIKLGRSELEGPVAAVWDLAPGTLPEELAELLGEAFAERFGLRLEAEEPRAAELEHVRAREGHFTSTAFVRRR